MNVKSLLSKRLNEKFKKIGMQAPTLFLSDVKVERYATIYKKLFCDAFYRACKYRHAGAGQKVYFFNIFERGIFYKKKHTKIFLTQVFKNLEALGYLDIYDSTAGDATIKFDNCV